MKNLIVALALMAILFVPILSCQKDFIFNGKFLNPLEAGCQVAEYHNTLYDEFFPPKLPYPFKKTFDPSGKIVKEIECFFQDDVSPSVITQPEFHHIFKIDQVGRKVFLINKEVNKGDIPDTVATITLNKKGRAESCKANIELDPDFIFQRNVTEHYLYVNDRVIAIKSDYEFPESSLPPGFNPYSTVDSIFYDTYGNLLFFGGNSFQYDYNRRARQQFYCDDFIGGDEPFYLLQYLGYFPEINSPPNVRIRVDNVIFHGNLTNHQFDEEGRLISYEPGPGLQVTVMWNCKANSKN